MATYLRTGSTNLNGSRRLSGGVCGVGSQAPLVVQLLRLLPLNVLLRSSEFMQDRFSQASVATNEITDPLIDDELHASA